MRKLVWLSWHSNPYNDFLFSKICSDTDVELEVIYAKKILETHPWNEDNDYQFDSDFLKTTFGLDISFLRRCALSNDCYFLISGWNHPTMFAALTILSLLGKPFAIWSDTPDVQIKRTGYKSSLRSKWLQYIYRHMDRFLTTGNVGVEAFAQLGAPREKLYNFPFVTDLNFFKPIPKLHPKKIEPLQIVTCGRLVNSHKGHDLSIRALSQFPDLDFQFRIAGVGPDFEELTRLVEELGMQEKVIFEGWKEISDLPGFYNSGHVYLHTSHMDAFPNSVLESMACAVPVVGSNRAGSIVDRVVNDVNGYVHESGDIDSIVAAFQRFLDNIDRLDELKENARRTAEKHPVEYNLRMVNQMLGAPVPCDSVLEKEPSL